MKVPRRHTTEPFQGQEHKPQECQRGMGRFEPCQDWEQGRQAEDNRTKASVRQNSIEVAWGQEGKPRTWERWRQETKAWEGHEKEAGAQKGWEPETAAQEGTWDEGQGPRTGVQGCGLEAEVQDSASWARGSQLEKRG